MRNYTSMFGQILKMISRPVFERAVRETQAERNAKGFTWRVSRFNSIDALCREKWLTPSY